MERCSSTSMVEEQIIHKICPNHDVFAARARKKKFTRNARDHLQSPAFRILKFLCVAAEPVEISQNSVTRSKPHLKVSGDSKFFIIIICPSSFETDCDCRINFNESGVDSMALCIVGMNKWMQRGNCRIRQIQSKG